MNLKKLSNLIIILLIGFSLIIVYLSKNHLSSTPFYESATATELSPRLLSIAKKTVKTTASIGAIGDILIHDRVYLDVKTVDQYDFEKILLPVQNLLREPDLCMANQESIAGGAEIGLSGYPSFNSPYDITDALMSAGVDIVNMANNHTLDKGERGIKSATNYYKKVGMPYVGAYPDKADAQKDRILNINGIRIGFLSYTYGTNGIKVPRGKEFLVNYLDEDKIIRDLKRIEKKVDITFVNAHWGIEYERNPSADQKRIARLMAENGADVIIGHHPHVLQPMEWIQSKQNKTLVIYSLGNFLSGQVKDYKDIGGIVNLKLTKVYLPDEKNSTTVSDIQFTPTYMSSSNQRNYQVLPFETATAFGSERLNKEAEIKDFMLAPLRK